MANETRAQLALVTGDLVTTRYDSLIDCLDVLRGLRAEAGLLGCLGNHEIFADCEDEAAERAARFGLRFLRRQNAEFQFGSATLNVAGTDYQRMNRPYLQGAKRSYGQELSTSCSPTIRMSTPLRLQKASI
jgi:predicted MPP superfamily phosphohydrolase